ncbi:MAG TPA: RDD family protein [Hanamia sp.]|nr:RDD family protein [Hanamia sp.]
MPLIQIETAFNIDLEFEIAETHKRLFAYLIDFSILILFFTSMKYFYYGGFNLAGINTLKSHVGLDILTISIPMLLYSLICEVLMDGQTIGKKMLNIRVISLDGGEPSLSQYIVRWIFKVFEWPFFFGYTYFSLQSILGYIIITGFWGLVVLVFIAVSKKNQRLGDIAANTVVVNTQSPFSVDDTIFMNVAERNYVVTFPEVLKLSDRDINTIKNVINLYRKEHNTKTCDRVALKVQEVLDIHSNMNSIKFLETLLADYNYLATV